MLHYHLILNHFLFNSLIFIYYSKYFLLYFLLFGYDFILFLHLSDLEVIYEIKI